MGRDLPVDGEWRVDGVPTSDETGTFQRVEAMFRDRVRDDPDARFPAEPDRHHLYIARNCPWAHGTALTRRLLGLTDVVSLDVVDPRRGGEGREFTPRKDGCTADTVYGADYRREV